MPFLGPAGLTSVCFPSHSPVSYHISVDDFEVRNRPHNIDSYIFLKKSTGSSCIKKVHMAEFLQVLSKILTWHDNKEIPLNVYNLPHSINTLKSVEITVVVLFHWDSHTVSFFSLFHSTSHYVLAW